MEILDLSGLKCPLPVLRTRKALRAIESGVLEVHCTDALAVIDIPNLVREMDCVLLEHKAEGVKLIFRIQKGLEI
jgi:tRNA 2-thiouridine synthesizing protein A